MDQGHVGREGRTSGAAASTRSPPKGGACWPQQRKTWAAFVEAVRRVTGGEHA